MLGTEVSQTQRAAITRGRRLHICPWSCFPRSSPFLLPCGAAGGEAGNPAGLFLSSGLIHGGAGIDLAVEGWRVVGCPRQRRDLGKSGPGSGWRRSAGLGGCLRQRNDISTHILLIRQSRKIFKSLFGPFWTLPVTSPLPGPLQDPSPRRRWRSPTRLPPRPHFPSVPGVFPSAPPVYGKGKNVWERKQLCGGAVCRRVCWKQKVLGLEQMHPKPRSKCTPKNKANSPQNPKANAPQNPEQQPRGAWQHTAAPCSGAHPRGARNSPGWGQSGEQLPASTAPSRVCDPAPRLSHTPISPAGNKTTARSLGADHLLTKSQKEKKKSPKPPIANPAFAEAAVFAARGGGRLVLELPSSLPGGMGWGRGFWGGFCHCFRRDVCSGCRNEGVKAPGHGSAKLGTPRTHGNLQGCALPVGQRQNLLGNFAL